MSRISRLPIRIRVTLVFTTVMAVVLSGVGLFLYLRLASELDASVERSLRSRAVDVTALVKQADSGLAESGRSPLTERGENLAQILDRSGRVVDGTPEVRDRPLLTTEELQRALRGTIFVTASPDDEPSRLLGTPVNAQDQLLVVIVGTRLDERDDAVQSLGGLLLIGGPVALLLAALTGLGALTAALRPVERMRQRAAAIQDAAPGQRLPVPAAADEIRRLGDTLNAMLWRRCSLASARSFRTRATSSVRRWRS